MATRTVRRIASRADSNVKPVDGIATDNDNGHRVLYSDGLSSLRELEPWEVDLYYPPKREPMPDGLTHHAPFIKYVEMLRRGLAAMGVHAFVVGDVYIYYLDEYGQRVKVAPDAFVTLGLSWGDEAIENYESYFIELVGTPDFAMEMASKSTYRVDLELKRETYAYLGIPEYWLFDPTGGRYYGFPLQGLRLVDGKYVEMDMEEMPNGGLRGHSEVLGIDFYWTGDTLRLRNSATGEWVETPEEIAAARSREAARANAEEARANIAEARARDVEANNAALREEIRRLREGRGS